MAIEAFVSRLVRQSFHSAVMSAVRLTSRLLLSVALGKSLTAEEYGVYSLVAASMAMIGYFLQLGAHQYYMREVPGRPAQQGADLFKSIIGVQSILLLAISALVLSVPQFSVALSNLSGLEGNRAVLYLLVILLVADTLSLEFSRYLTARWQIEESNVVAFLQVSSWSLVVFCIFLIDATRVTVTLVLALWMVGMILAILYGVRSAGPAQLWHGKFQPAVYLAAVRFGMPLMLTNLAYLVIFWSDRYFIEIYHSSEAVGVYSYQYNIIAIIVAASAPIIGNVIDPYIVAANNTGDREGSRALLNAALRHQIILVAPILLIVSFWGTELVTLLASAQYASATNLLAVLAPIPVITILANTFQRVLFLRRRTALIGVSYLLAALLNLALNWLLVPRHPYYGAAIATDLSLLFIAILLWHHGRSSSSIVALSELYRIGIPFAAGVAVALATAWVAPWHHPLPSLAVGSLNVAAAYLGSLWFLGGLTQQERALVRRIRLHVFRNR